MKELSVFDIIGPNMIGPSSSHTAGALRIALLAGKMVKHTVTAVEFVLYGSFARTYQGHGTDRALVGGILGFSPEDCRIRDSFQIAGERGLKFSFRPDTQTRDVHPNTVDVILTEETGTVPTVRGESIGGGAAVIKQINGVDIKLNGELSTILIRQKDTPGVLAHIALCFARNHINIAFTRMYREAKGEMAYTIIEADGAIPQEVLLDIEQSPSVVSAILIEL